MNKVVLEVHIFAILRAFLEARWFAYKYTSICQDWVKGLKEEEFLWRKCRSKP
jgi:hypothetical protein